MKTQKIFKGVSLAGILFWVLGMLFPYIYVEGLVYSYEEKDLQYLSLLKFTKKRFEYNLDDAGMYTFFMIVLALITLLTLFFIPKNKPIGIIICGLINQVFILLISSDMKEQKIVADGRYKWHAGYYVHLVGLILLLVGAVGLLIYIRREKNEKVN